MLTRRAVMSIVFLSATFSTAATAQTLCPPQDYDSENEPDFTCPSPSETSLVPRLSPPDSIPVEADDTIEVPWDGAIVHRDRLIQMGLTITALRRLRWLDRLRFSEEYQTRQEYQETLCDANLAHSRAELNMCSDALEEANGRIESSQAWYRSWTFGFILGVVSAGALVALSAWALTAL